jgi:hypothetical protein
MSLAPVNANVNYNYQKNSNVVTSDGLQSLAGLTLVLRDNPTKNRNINFQYPINFSTPNPGAGSPTVLAVQSPKSIGLDVYAGQQNNF